jgi:hypothetical protein
MSIAANGYSRPGVASLDGTLDAATIRDECRKLGYEYWGAVDLALPPSLGTDAAQDILARLYANGARLACLRPQSSALRDEDAAVAALRKWLSDHQES